MGTIKFDVPDEVEERFRERAMRRFGHRRGSISKAGEAALLAWVADQEEGLDVTPSEPPIADKRGALAHVDHSSTELKHGLGDVLLEDHRETRSRSE